MIIPLQKFGVDHKTISDIQLGKTYKNAVGTIRQAQKRSIITDEMKKQILADYQPNVRGHGCTAVGKRFGIDAKTVWNIVNGR